MNNKKLGIVIFSCLVAILIANIPASPVLAEKQIKSSQTNTIYIIPCKKVSCFIPCQKVVLKGDTVTWINLDSVPHMILSGSSQHGPDGQFSSPVIHQHQAFSYKFDRLGPFVYFDLFHPNAQGVVIVANAINSSNVKLQLSFFSDWCTR